MSARRNIAVVGFCLLAPLAIIVLAVVAGIVTAVVMFYALAQIIAGFIAGAWSELFGWELHHSNGAWAYYINPGTGARKAVYVAGHSPIEYRFLRPGDMIIDEVGSQRKTDERN